MPTSTLLTQIDELTRADHHYLANDDYCCYLRIYTPGVGYADSETNSLIFNLKKSPLKRARPEYHYKVRAIRQCATELRAAFGRGLEHCTVVPIPPSKTKGHPEHDDRMLQVARQLTHGTTAEVVEALIQRVDTEPDHTGIGKKRRTPEEVAANYQLAAACSAMAPVRIWLLDDVITTGSHFKAAQSLLKPRFPRAEIWGVFVARRQPSSEDFDSPFL